MNELKKMRTPIAVVALLLMATLPATAQEPGLPTELLIEGVVVVDSWIVPAGATYTFAPGARVEADFLEIRGTLAAQPGHHDGPDLVLYGHESLVISGAILGAPGASYASMDGSDGGNGSSIVLASKDLQLQSGAVVKPGAGGNAAPAVDLDGPIGTTVKGGNGGDAGTITLVGNLTQALLDSEGRFTALYHAEGGEAGYAMAGMPGGHAIGGDGGQGGGAEWIPTSQSSSTPGPSSRQPKNWVYQNPDWIKPPGVHDLVPGLVMFDLGLGDELIFAFALQGMESCSGKDGADASANGANAQGHGQAGASGDGGTAGVGDSGSPGGTGPRGENGGTVMAGNGSDGCWWGNGGNGGDATANGGNGGQGGRGGDGASDLITGGDGGPGGTGGRGGDGGHATGGKPGCGGAFGRPGAPGTAFANPGFGGPGGEGGQGGSGNHMDGRNGARGTTGSPGTPGTANTQPQCTNGEI